MPEYFTHKRRVCQVLLLNSAEISSKNVPVLESVYLKSFGAESVNIPSMIRSNISIIHLFFAILKFLQLRQLP